MSSTVCRFVARGVCIEVFRSDVFAVFLQGGENQVKKVHFSSKLHPSLKYVIALPSSSYEAR